MTESVRQCPLCGEADQHSKDCILNGKPHVYHDITQEVDWPRTLAANKITIPLQDRSRRRR